MSTQQEFIQIIEALRLNYLEHPEEWEHKTIPDFLEAIAWYAEDIDGYYKNTDQAINLELVDWKVFWDIVQWAKIYE